MTSTRQSIPVRHATSIVMMLTLTLAACGNDAARESSATEGSGGSAPAASWNAPRTFGELSADAEVVVTGELVRRTGTVTQPDFEGQEIEDVSRQYAFYDFRVSDVLKGDKTIVGTVIPLSKWEFYVPEGGRGEEINSAKSNTSRLEAGTELMLLLVLERLEGVWEGERYSVLSSDLGVFDIQPDGSYVQRADESPMADVAIPPGEVEKVLAEQAAKS